MKIKLSHLAFAVVVAAAGGQASAQASKPIVKVNGTPVSAEMADLLIQEEVSKGAPNDAELRNAVRDELVRREVLAQEARKQGLEKRADVVARLSLTRQGILVGGYINDWLNKRPISDAALRAEYDRLVGSMSATEYRVRHIQTDKEDAAKALIQKLQAGAKFEDLAKESIDQGSRDSGGEIGWVSPKGVPEAFGKAIESLEKGKFSPIPVQTPFGYHVIKVEDTRKAVPPKFEERKDEIRESLQQQALNKHIQELVAKAKVE